MERACGAGLLLGCVTDGVLCADLSPHQTFSVSSECNCVCKSSGLENPPGCVRASQVGRSRPCAPGFG